LVHLGRVVGNFSDHDLELFQKGVEPAGQFGDFVLGPIVNAFGQIAFAFGDILTTV
jgi:uncharacterized SAM-dependent methyltransferase